jgi:ubiquinone/menaquinone biosynthesis C-methylase UbiE
VEAMSAKFWDKLAKRYAKQPVADVASYEKKLEITRGYFRPDTQVLEFGCGTGSTAISHAPFVDHIRAIDVSEKMLEIARERAVAAGVTNITFERSTVEAMQAPDGSVDVVLGMSILHLLEDKEAAIEKVHRMLKPDGVFISSTVCLGGSMMRAIAWVAPIGKLLGLLPLLRAFTADHLEGCLTQAGYTIEYRWQPGKNKAVFMVAKKSA